MSYTGTARERLSYTGTARERLSDTGTARVIVSQKSALGSSLSKASVTVTVGLPQVKCLSHFPSQKVRQFF